MTINLPAQADETYYFEYGSSFSSMGKASTFQGLSGLQLNPVSSESLSFSVSSGSDSAGFTTSPSQGANAIEIPIGATKYALVIAGSSEPETSYNITGGQLVSSSKPGVPWLDLTVSADAIASLKTVSGLYIGNGTTFEFSSGQNNDYYLRFAVFINSPGSVRTVIGLDMSAGNNIYSAGGQSEMQAAVIGAKGIESNEEPLTAIGALLDNDAAINPTGKTQTYSHQYLGAVQPTGGTSATMTAYGLLVKDSKVDFSGTTRSVNLAGLIGYDQSGGSYAQAGDVAEDASLMTWNPCYSHPVGGNSAKLLN